jgi:iron-sulfur cluster repair protein YtfE (RIC family)
VRNEIETKRNEINENETKRNEINKNESQLIINHVFNIYHGRAPEYLCENFNINQGNTRGASNSNCITPNAKDMVG